MRNIFLGFAAGLVVSGLLYFRFDVEPRNTEATAPNVPIATDAVSVGPPPNSPQLAGLPGGGGGAAEDSEPVEALSEISSVSAEEATGARLRRELEEAQAVVFRTTAELERLGIEEALAAEPIISPIVLPSDFDWIKEEFYREVFHERMQREQIDGSWAGATESVLLNFLYSRPELVSKYGPPTVRCHSTQCEVTFVAHGVFDDPSVASTVARSLFDSSFEEMPGLFDCGPGECWAEANSQDGVVTIFWGMTKDDGRTQSGGTVRAALR